MELMRRYSDCKAVVKEVNAVLLVLWRYLYLYNRAIVVVGPVSRVVYSDRLVFAAIVDRMNATSMK